MEEAPERIWVQWPHAKGAGLAFTCQARPPAFRHEYTLSAAAQRIVDGARTAPQWDTTHDKLLPSASDNLPPSDEVARLREALADHNDLLRSAIQIAKREGIDGIFCSTNWDAYYNRVAVVLKRHHEIANLARATLEQNKSAT